MPMSKASGMQEALREVVGKEIMVVVISQCEYLSYFDQTDFVPVDFDLSWETTSGSANLNCRSDS